MRNNDLLSPIDAWFQSHADEERECYFFLRQFIQACDERLTETWKYRMPIYCVNGKMCCYIWKDKKTNQPYVGFIPGNEMDHPQLVLGNRAKMKVLYIDPRKTIPVKLLKTLIKQAVSITANKR